MSTFGLDEAASVIAYCRRSRDIHPLAILSQTYFENMFCLLPFSTASSSKNVASERSEIGVKVALGDSSTFTSTCLIGHIDNILKTDRRARDDRDRHLRSTGTFRGGCQQYSPIRGQSNPTTFTTASPAAWATTRRPHSA